MSFKNPSGLVMNEGDPSKPVLIQFTIDCVKVCRSVFAITFVSPFMKQADQSVPAVPCAVVTVFVTSLVGTLATAAAAAEDPAVAEAVPLAAKHWANETSASAF